MYNATFWYCYSLSQQNKRKRGSDASVNCIRSCSSGKVHKFTIKVVWIKRWRWRALEEKKLQKYYFIDWLVFLDWFPLLQVGSWCGLNSGIDPYTFPKRSSENRKFDACEMLWLQEWSDVSYFGIVRVFS